MKSPKTHSVEPVDVRITNQSSRDENTPLTAMWKTFLIWFILGLGACLLSFALTEVNMGAPAFWIVTPLLVGALLNSSYRVWPAIITSMIAGGLVAAVLLPNSSIMSVVWNVSLSIPTSILMTFAIHNIYHKPGTEFNAINALGAIILCAVGPTIISASIATFVISGKPTLVWTSWYVSQILGVVIVLPMALIFKREIFLGFNSLIGLTKMAGVLALSLGVSWFSLLTMDEPHYFAMLPLILGAIILPLPHSLFVTAATGVFIASLTSIPLNFDYGNKIGDPLQNVSVASLMLISSVLSIMLNNMRMERTRLQASEAKFRDAMRFSPVGMALTTMNGKFLLINESLCRMTGYDGREMNFKSLIDLVSIPQRQSLMANIQGLISSESNVLRRDVSLTHKTGNSISSKIAASIMRKSNGEPIGMVVQFEDFNEMETARRALRTSEERFEFAVNGSDIGVWDINVKDQRAYYSIRCQDMMGVAQEEKIQSLTDWFIHVHPSDREESLALADEHISGGSPLFVKEHRIVRAGQPPLWVLTRGKVIQRDSENTPVRMVGTITDVTAQKQSEIALIKMHERMTLATDAARIGVWEWVFEDNQMIWDDRMFEFFETTREEFIPTPTNWTQFIHEEDQGKAQNLINSSLAGDHAEFDLELKYHHGDEVRYARNLGTVIRAADGHVTRIVGAFWDTTERTLLQSNLREERNRLAVSLNAIADAVITTDERGRIIFMNPAAKTMMSTDLSLNPNVDVFGLFTLRDDAGRPMDTHPVRECLRKKELSEVILPTRDITLTNAQGKDFDVEITVSPMISELGFVGSLVAVHDVTHTKEMQRKLTYSASHDALTGLHNRSFFEVEVQRNLERAKAEDQEHVLCFLDLDKFKIVNDSAGHSVGDIMLKNVSKVIEQCVRNSDVLARIGGDEFGILLLNCSLSQAESVCEKIISTVSTIRFTWEDTVYDIGASIGIVSVNSKSRNIAEVMSQADVACYAAKHGGRNRCSIYENGHTEVQRRHKEIFLAAGLRDAIESNRMVLYAQRITSIQNAEDDDMQVPPRHHYELLLRMLDKNGEMIPPGAFIPAAERFELMSSIDRWVVETALLKYGPRISKIPGFSVAINISANSLSDDTFMSFLLDTVGISLVPSKAITFEVTETSLMNHMSVAAGTLSKMREIGCKVALDDFGSGLSSYTYLKNFKVDIIKIDGGFVKQLHTNVVDWTIVDSMNQVAHRLGAETVAEFVENDSILRECRSIGIDYAQGYGIAKPVSIEQLLDELEHKERILVA